MISRCYKRTESLIDQHSDKLQQVLYNVLCKCLNRLMWKSVFIVLSIAFVFLIISIFVCPIIKVAEELLKHEVLNYEEIESLIGKRPYAGSREPEG